jgi:hypothetical protein
MAPILFVGIPCFEATKRFRRTMKFFQQRTVLPHVLEAHVEKQSVVRNKNKLLERARKSGVRYVCFADDDVEPPYSWDEALVHGMEVAQKQLGIPIGQTGPRFIHPDGSAFADWMDVAFGPKLETNFGDGRHSSSSTACCLAGALTGTLSIFSAAFLDSISWAFDDRYERSQWEDIDQSLTCRDKGFALLYNGRVAVMHYCERIAPRHARENLNKIVTKWGERHDLSMPEARFIDLETVGPEPGYDSWPLSTRLLYRLTWSARKLARRARASIAYRSRLIGGAIAQLSYGREDRERNSEASKV